MNQSFDTTQDKKGFSNVVIGIIVVVILIAAGGYFVLFKKAEISSTKTAQDLEAHRSDIFGLEVQYPADIWIKYSVEEPDETEYSIIEGLYSKEPPSQGLSENDYDDAKYRFVWSYVPKSKFSSYEEWGERWCPSELQTKEASIERMEVTIDGVLVQGCKRIYPLLPQSGDTAFHQLFLNLHLIHPATNIPIELGGISDFARQEEVDEIFGYFDAVIATIKFYEPSEAGFEAVEKSQTVPTSIEKAQNRDALKRANIGQVQLGLNLYHKDFGDYPPTISSLVPKYYPVSKNSYVEILSGPTCLDSNHG